MIALRIASRSHAEQLPRHRHVGPLVVPGGRVQPADQVGQRLVGAAVAVPGGGGVLDLHQRHDLGPEGLDGGDDLRGLLVELGLAGGATRVRSGGGEEVVEHVERAHLDVAADLRRGRGTGVRGGEGALGRPVRRLQPPGAEAEGQHRGRGEPEAVADPDRRGRGEVGAAGRAGAGAAPVVQDQGPPGVRGSNRLGAGPGRAASVGVTSRPPSLSVSSPKLVRANTSLTVSRSTGRTSMPSTRSRTVSSAGRSSGAAAGRSPASPPAQTSTAAEPIWVWPNASDALPLTATASPRPTAAVLATKIPSEVARSPSPSASCR